MARLPRLSLARVAHLLVLRGHNGETVFHDDEDRGAFLAALQTAFEREQVALHAYALLFDRAWLLCTPAQDQGLSRAMQSVGRRFAAAFNRRYSRSGSLWDGRFRSTVVEPGRTLLEAMIFVDQLQADPIDSADRVPSQRSSARQHLGSDGSMQLKDIEEYWALGNTPFERATAYRALLTGESFHRSEVERITAAAQRGWALGSSDFIETLQVRTARPLRPRPKGRPRSV